MSPYQSDRLKDRFCIQFFVLRQRPRTSLQCFALEHSLYKAKHCRDVLGRCLRTKNQIQNRSLNDCIMRNDNLKACETAPSLNIFLELQIISVYVSKFNLTQGLLYTRITPCLILKRSIKLCGQWPSVLSFPLPCQVKGLCLKGGGQATPLYHDSHFYLPPPLHHLMWAIDLLRTGNLQDWYFVSKIVASYCEKKLFQ